MAFRAFVTSALLASLLGVAGVANAAFATFTSQATFLNTISRPGTDTFDSVPLGELGASLSRTAGSYQYVASAPNNLFGLGTGADHWLSINDRQDSLAFGNFTGNVTAIGGFFFATDVTGGFFANQPITVSVTDALANVFTTVLSAGTPTTFFGVLSDSRLTSMTLTATGIFEAWPTGNNLILGIPEPGTYAMVLLGLTLVGWATRRASSR